MGGDQLDQLDHLGANRVFAELEEKRKQAALKREGAAVKREIYRGEELRQLFELRRRLLEAGYKADQIEADLDSQIFWAYKFSTQPGSGSDTELEISNRDSLYYVTPNGLSLRFKRVLLYEPTEDEPLIYPVFEKVVFRKSGEQDFTNIPNLGDWAGEFASSDFLKLQKDFKNGVEIPAEYKSKLGFFEKNDKIVGVGSEIANEDPYHNGDRVNKIFKL